MHYAVSRKDGQTVVTVRSHARDLQPKKIGYILWGPDPAPKEARFLMNPAFLGVLPKEEIPWKERLKMIAAALILQHWRYAEMKRHAVMKNRVDPPALPEDVQAWIEEITTMQIPANQLEKNASDVKTAFEALRRAGHMEHELHALLRAGA